MNTVTQKNRKTSIKTLGNRNLRSAKNKRLWNAADYNQLATDLNIAAVLVQGSAQNNMVTVLVRM